MIRSTLSAAVLTVFLAIPAQAELIRKQSPHSVKETVDRLESAIKDRGLTVVVRVDHAAAAKKAGLELRPTELIIFGSAAVGTPLMQQEQTMGLSLPIKALAWQDATGQVWLGYDAPASMASERGVPGDHPVVQKIGGALKALSDDATKK
jgi:uncharacterized protein (DUF302 family)